MGKIRDFFRRFASSAPDILRGQEPCSVCGEVRPVCCLVPGEPRRCDFHCNHLDREGKPYPGRAP